MATGSSVVEPVGVGSLVSRARAAILDSVLAGRFPGDRLPPEPALASMLGVSRTTVRAALQRLEQDGVLMRARGRGTTIRREGIPMVALHHLVGFTQLLEEGGHTVTRRTEWRITTVAEAEPLKQAGLALDEQCFVWEKLLCANDQPAVWLRDTFPLAVFTELPRRTQRLPESIFEISDQFFRERINYARVQIIPSKATRHIAALLEMRIGEPYLLLKEMHYSDKDVFLGASEVHVRDRFLRFEALRRR